METKGYKHAKAYNIYMVIRFCVLVLCLIMLTGCSSSTDVCEPPGCDNTLLSSSEVNELCGSTWQEVDKLFEDADYCINDNDCVFADDLSCGKLVNKNEKDKIEKNVKELYDAKKSCISDPSCKIPDTKTIRCDNNKCVVNYMD